MARMIPLHLPQPTDSEAEASLFYEFERHCPQEWVVLHSLDLAQRGTGPLGEADFVVVAPGFGILVIEAKTYLSRNDDGEWLTHPLEPPKPRSPFRQATDSAHRIKDWLRSHQMPDAVISSVVMVPGMDVVNHDQIEWSSRQLIDRSRYRSKSLEQLVIECIDGQRGELLDPAPPLTRENAERIVRCLRGTVECYLSPKARIEQELDQIKRYTQEQYRVLDQMDGNPRLLIDGLAGTGKTLLAIESARRAVESERRVLLLCFNRLLCEWLQAETAAFGEACTTVSIHAYMQSIVGDTWRPGLTTDYWDRELPERVFLELAERSAVGAAAQFDEIVIDEAQDIIGKQEFLDVLDTVLSGGLEHGRWRFFGDFGHQDIFGRLHGSPQLVLETVIGYQPPVVTLRENCRNLPRVAHLAGAVAKVPGGYRDYRRDDDGRNPHVLFYDGAKTAKKALVQALDELVEEGFEPSSIVVLSRHSVANALAASIDAPPWDSRLKPLAEVGAGGYTGYDSIYRFKGREAPAIVITDFDPLQDDGRWSDEADARALLYVGLTRAISRVVVVAHEWWRDRLEWEPMDGLGDG